MLSCCSGGGGGGVLAKQSVAIWHSVLVLTQSIQPTLLVLDVPLLSVASTNLHSLNVAGIFRACLFLDLPVLSAPQTFAFVFMISAFRFRLVFTQRTSAAQHVPCQIQILACCLRSHSWWPLLLRVWLFIRVATGAAPSAGAHCRFYECFFVLVTVW
jgi:hypothetical protein